MIIEGLAVAAATKFVYSLNKAVTIDEKAMNQFAKAFAKNKEAQILLEEKAEFADKRLMNVAKKKRAILNRTVPKFVEVYSQIQKVELKNRPSDNEITIRNDIQNKEALNELKLTSKKSFTDKELICGLLTKGMCRLMIMDSERNLSAANSQLRSANVVYSQAESIAAFYDAIVERADRISNLLMSMNALFIRVINETEKTIHKNGFNVRNYSEYEKGLLMTCVNIAVAMTDMVNIPVVDENGAVAEAAMKTITAGEAYLKKINDEL